MDDLLDVDIGKHDYDWLLTPPGTPREPKLEHIERKPVPTVSISTTFNNNTVPKRTPVRSSSTTRASRLPTNTTQPTENGHGPPTRPVRSSSVTRSRTTPTINTSIRTNTNLNASSLSLSSSRPSTPTKRTPSLTRPSVPVVSSSRTSRSSTPVKSRPSQPSVAKPNPNSRSSTPTRPRTATSASSSGYGTAPRAATSASSNGFGTGAVPTRSISRSSTPTRTSSSSTIRSSTPTRTSSSSTIHSSAPTRTSSSSTIRSSTPTRTSSSSTIRSSTPTRTNSTSSSLKRIPSTSGLNSAPSSRPSSPGQRIKPPVRPLDIPDFPNETPPNLRTKLPERPASAGRTRPGMSLTQRSSSQPDPVPAVRKSVPVVSRSKFTDGPSKVGTGLSNGHLSNKSVQKPAGTGSDFGRNISKKSLDMAIRHMDIKQNLGGIKGVSLFPHSIRSNSSKPGQRPARSSDPPAHSRSTSNDRISENGSLNSSRSNGNNSPDRNILVLKESLNEMDLYGSSRYDTMLLKEDAKNTSWLHGIGDDDEKSLIFDHRFDSLPEPF
ncbi:hypothetical protein LUZ60_011045 [Juncus effusus]|nr:hypothetical protein LUZ60_011045 [Juncus effusus]